MCERSTENGRFKSKLEERFDRKISPQIFGKRQARDLKPAKADGGVLVTEGCINKGPEPPEFCRAPRKNNALRKKRPEGYVNKEKRTKGTLIRNFLPFLPKGTSIRTRKR